jgi:hypothetical protein
MELAMASDPTKIWRSMTIEKALDLVAEPLIGRGLATEDRGYSEKAIKAANKRLGRPLPPELAAFYRRVTPVSKCPEEWISVGFQPLNGLTRLDNPQLRKKVLWVCPPEDCWLEGWPTARLLVIGYTPFGDWLLWADELPGRPNGTIILTDHEGEDNPIVVGDSFAQWLGRYATYGYIEYSIVEGGLLDLKPAEAIPFLRDHLRLNPGCSWAKKRLESFLRR